MLTRHGVPAAALAALVVAATAVMWLRAPAHPPWQALLDGVLVLSVCGTLALWRRRPVAGCVYGLAATGAYYILSPVDGPLIIVTIVNLYGVAATGRVRTATALGAVLVIAAGLGTLAGNRDVNSVAIIMMTGWVVALIALGAVRHGRREALRAAVRRAEEEARWRATAERLRIARELHDVVGHHLSMINVQAGTALHRLHRDPEQAGRALAVIKEASRDTLREMRAALGVLRAVDEEPGTAPAGRLDRLDDLVRHAELASLETTVRVEGEPRPLPAGVDLAAYRILQESITNVTRHAAARRVTLRIGYGTAHLLVEVEDDGRGAAVDSGGDGNGIRGMRERARALGGELTAGPLPGGGFRVRARLPYGADR
ncbi:two-component sensor histidine kinase [Actinomadura rubrobrunea]|uniref:histidine kinase n=1 Tax=Actinomadura rubrobrunea TaxID=115335 RepID=A0A9W6Q0H6_9ACTN|nr:sensor histidine kinase [Actinomadura rubrobrunea]GLW66218.1 two-component sensor histidine kinase [Actinomadura rubrobrunea]